MVVARSGRTAAVTCGCRGPVTAIRLAGFLLVANTTVAAEQGSVLFREDFESGLGARWVERGFPSITRRNVFSLGQEPNGNRYLRVESADSYSGRGVYVSLSPERCMEVSWRWLVSDVVTTADITRREGDDGAAKLYVVFAGPSWWNPLDKRMLIYVWDNKALAGAIVPNAWLPKKARMVVLRSGRAQTGEWVEEHVRPAEDFGRGFPGELPGRVEGLVFLADTDNTHGRVSAGFDDLVVRCVEPGERPPVR